MAVGTASFPPQYSHSPIPSKSRYAREVEDDRTYADDSTSTLSTTLAISSGYAFVEFEDERDAEE